MWYIKVVVYLFVIWSFGDAYRPENHLVNHDVSSLPHGPRTTKITYQLPTGRGKYRLDKPPPRRPGRLRGRKVPRAKLKPVIEDITFEGNVGKEHLQTVFKQAYPYPVDKKPEETMSQDDWQKLKELFFTGDKNNELDFMINDWSTTTTTPSPSTNLSQDFDWVSSPSSSATPSEWVENSSPGHSTSSSSDFWDTTPGTVLDFDVAQSSSQNPNTYSRPTPPKPKPVKSDDRRPVTFDGGDGSSEQTKNVSTQVKSTTKMPLISYYDTDAPPGVYEEVDESLDDSSDDLVKEETKKQDVKPIFEEPEEMVQKPTKISPVKVKPDKFKPSPPLKHAFESDEYEQLLSLEDYDSDSFKPSLPIKFEEPSVKPSKSVYPKQYHETFKPSHPIFEEPTEFEAKLPPNKQTYRKPSVVDVFRPSPPLKHPVYEEPEEEFVETKPKITYDSFKPSPPIKHHVFEEPEEIHHKHKVDPFRPSPPIKHPVFEETEEYYEKLPQVPPPKPVKHPIKKAKESDFRHHPKPPQKHRPPKAPSAGPIITEPIRTQKVVQTKHKKSPKTPPPPPGHWHFDSYEDCDYDENVVHTSPPQRGRPKKPSAPKHPKRFNSQKVPSDSHVPVPEY